MTHYSEVAAPVFAHIKHGDKVIEPRVNDTAHQRVRIGDMLVIINRATREELVTKVVGLLRYPTFDALFAAFPPRYFGVDDTGTARAEVAKWYDTAAERQHGVLGIKLHVLRAK